ncbi:MAG: hypothetical protein IJS94_02120 [Clostridia bacterium]|nr:hypothetical protein [Clostridia bacterium]
MARQQYIIPQISALSITSAAEGSFNHWRFYFDATETSKEYLVKETKQDDCPMFHQAMCVMYGDHYRAEPLSDKLKDAIIYIDFTGVLSVKRFHLEEFDYNKAIGMLGPKGIVLNLGKGKRRYLPFERSASMSRNCVLSYIREDLYEPLRERIMLGMNIGKCQLAKLYAYNGLMYTSGRRYNDISILSSDKIIVIDNPKSIVKDAHIITVEDDGTNEPVRDYHRVEKIADVEVLEFDGEGIVSKELARKLDPTAAHHSFQIRMPYIKGVVHEIDVRSLFSHLGVSKIKDIWGEEHDVSDIEMILTKSMFKGFGWMTENGLSWSDYLERCRRYGHALYISGTDKAERESVTELNYQFLNTLALTEDEFRPKDLPLGWDRSPKTDSRHWLTKTTEIAYYELLSDDEKRLAYFLKDLRNEELSLTDRRRQRAEVVKKNPLFLEESIFTTELSDNAESIRKKYSLGQLLISGDNRYLSDDLIRLLAYIVKSSVGEGKAYEKLKNEELSGNEIYAPSPAYKEQDHYTLLRSPHIARNEEAPVRPLANVGKIRDKYLSHLYYVLMVDSRSLIPERLGGADYDGDMIKTIADPLVNNCVLRGYAGGEELPVLKIPAAEPLISDANDWKARRDTIENTFSTRVGQMSNAALRHGITAYDENNDDDAREKSRMNTEALAILTGLEIDSAKTGVKPSLLEYIVKQNPKKSLFLKYKYIVGNHTERKWYEPTTEKLVKTFIQSNDWDSVSSNLELLPYYAYMLGKETKPNKPSPAQDEQLFVFASDPDWKEKLDPSAAEKVKSVIAAYHAAHARIKYVKHMTIGMKRKRDVERILFSRDQLDEINVNDLYGTFDDLPPQAIRQARLALGELKWHLVPKEEREYVWYDILPINASKEYMELFCDFRNSGYRLLGDIICDLDDLYRSRAISKNAIKRDDSPDLKAILNGALYADDYREAIVRNCVARLSPPDRHQKRIDMIEAVKCAVALGERRFALEVMPYSVSEAAISTAENKKRRFFRT